MAFLKIEHLEKSFGSTRVVKDFDLTIEKGEFVSLLGPSGCGKTTVLRMVAGFETPSSGAIIVDGKDVVALRPSQRNIGMVFQAYALFPNLTVAENVAFGLKIKGVAKDEREARVHEMLAMIGLPDLGGRYPFQLSGGQQQRVALARALAVKPQVLLLDEPLSALDAKIRVSLRAQIREIQRELQITTIFVTHDQEEALSISDRIVVMNGGVAEQVGAPFEIYNRPATRFVAQFVGTLNLIEADVVTPNTGTVRIGTTEISLGRALPAGRVTLACRPEAVSLGLAEGRPLVLHAEIGEVEFLGAVIRVRAQAGRTALSLDTFNRPTPRPPPPATRCRSRSRPPISWCSTPERLTARHAGLHARRWNRPPRPALLRQSRDTGAQIHDQDTDHPGPQRCGCCALAALVGYARPGRADRGARALGGRDPRRLGDAGGGRDPGASGVDLGRAWLWRGGRGAAADPLAAAAGRGRAAGGPGRS